VILLEQWLKNSTETLQDSWFYSDSHNDLPLLNLVAHPVAVDPDEKLALAAKEANWSMISLRNNNGSIQYFHK
jgi:phosphoserine phosphatase